MHSHHLSLFTQPTDVTLAVPAVCHPGLFQTFLNQANQSPDKIAVIYQDAQLSYRDLAKAVNALATNLISDHANSVVVGEKPNLIGVRCKSKLMALIAELAILQIGAAFVPFNMDEPEKRQTFMQAKSGISLMLTDNDERIQNTADLTYYNIVPLLKHDSSATVLDVAPVTESAQDLAYVLFTSGSTADNPKGVMRTRLGLTQQMIRDYRNDLALTASDCLLNLAVFTHDQAIVDCFAALLNGCTLCLYDMKEFSVKHLHDFMKKHNVTVFSSIPSIFSTVFENINDNNLFPALRVVTIGGEETLLEHAMLFQRTTPASCLFINGYGATEMSWISSYTITHQTDLDDLRSIPLGDGTKHATIKLIPFSDGNKSTNTYELCVSSDGLALGYLEDNKATEEAFFVEDGNRYYRTGDIVKVNDVAYNDLLFVGRKSWHEKINGKRINLREIENILKATLHIKDCIVLAFGEGQDKKLYAFYAKKIKDTDMEKLASKLKKYLKADMVPRLIPIEIFPTLANGKIDRQALKEILKNTVVLSDADKVAIKTMQESTVVEVAIEGFWREALELAVSVPLNKTNSFIALGGTSINAIRLINKINAYFTVNEQLDVDLSPRLLAGDQSAYEFFVNEVKNAYESAKKEKVKYQKPRYYEAHGIQVLYTDKQDSFFWGLNNRDVGFTDCKEVSLMCYDYSALALLTDYFNALLNIEMHLVQSKEHGFMLINQFIANPAGSSQIGLIFSVAYEKNNHVIPAVLCRGVANKKIALLFADCLNGDTAYSLKYDILKKDNLFMQIQEQFREIEMYFDLTGRQVDDKSCYTDTLLYLTAILQRNILNESTFLLKSMECAADYAGGRSNNPYLQSWKQFISPIQAFYHSQATLMPYFISALTDEQKSLIDQLKKYEIEHHLTKRVMLMRRGEKPSSEQMINTTLWDKSYEFKLIADKVYQDWMEKKEKNQQQSLSLSQSSATLFATLNDHDIRPATLVSESNEVLTM